MSASAITMMVLFMVVIWGGLAAAVIHLRNNPDETSGKLGKSQHATDDVLISQELTEKA